MHGSNTRPTALPLRRPGPSWLLGLTRWPWLLPPLPLEDGRGNETGDTNPPPCFLLYSCFPSPDPTGDNKRTSEQNSHQQQNSGGGGGGGWGEALFVSKATRMSQGGRGGSWEGKTRGVPGSGNSRTHSPAGFVPTTSLLLSQERHRRSRRLQHLPPTETFAGSLLCTVDHQLTGPWAQVQMGKQAEQRGGGCAHGRVLGAELRTQMHACPRAWPRP